MGNVKNNVLEAIGNTPLVNLERFCRELEVSGRIITKLEFYNPGLSKKDRITLQIIEDAEKDGRLKPGQTVVEMTSGSTGIGLSIVCSVKGYPFIAVMSEGNSIERVKMMQAYGARVELVPQCPGSVKGKVTGEDLALVDQRADELVEELGAFKADQFYNQSNCRAYERFTEEVLDETDGEVDVYVDFLGSGGSFTGVAKVLKEAVPQSRCYAVEPANSTYYSGTKHSGGHVVQGGGYCRDLPLFDEGCCDGYELVTDEEVKEMCRVLAKTEGIMAGFSTGANLAAAVKLLQGKEKGKTVMTLVNDHGLKYASTDLFFD